MNAPQKMAMQMMIDREVRRYQSDLRSWETQVTRSPRDLDAFRLASHKPVAGQYIRSLGALWQSDKSRAERAVEESLMKRAEAADITGSDYPSLMRLAQGHWPRVYLTLERRRRK